MSVLPGLRIGIRGAISGLVLASIAISAVGVHLLWWRTAERTSRTLANTINEQIVSAVGDELQSITTEALSARTAVRTLFQQGVLDTSEANKRKFVFLSQLLAQPTISSVGFGWPDGSFSAAHKLGVANCAGGLLETNGTCNPIPLAERLYAGGGQVARVQTAVAPQLLQDGVKRRDGG